MNINIWKGVWIMILWYNKGCKKIEWNIVIMNFFMENEK